MQFALFSQKGIIIVESPIVYPLMIKRVDWMTDLYVQDSIRSHFERGFNPDGL